MKLYYADTLMPRLACAVARIVAAPVEYVRLDFVRGDQRTPEFLALNPNGKAPLLVDGALRLWEADAIGCWLARRFAPALWPEDQVHELVRWLSWNARHFTEAGSMLYFEHVIKKHYLRQAPEDALVETALKNFRKFGAVLDARLAASPFVLGGSMTLADLALATALPWTHEAKLPVAEFPAIGVWYERIAALDGWRSPYGGTG